MRVPQRVILASIVLVLLSGMITLPGLTSMGVVNMQESTRVIVAREMLRNDEWIVPLRGGEPYIAKPPMFYWVQMGLARLRGDHEVREIDLRLAVALSGMLGVLATFIVGRRMLAIPEQPQFGERAALFGAMGLATGVLYVRSSRLGELDVMLAPFVVVAIGALYAAWRRAVDRRRTSWSAVLAATLATAGAAMVKGPPAMLVVAVAGFGAILVAAAGTVPMTPMRRRGARMSTMVGAALMLTPVIRGIDSVETGAGAVCFAMIGAVLGSGLWRVFRHEVLRELLPVLGRMHPWLVLGVPAGVVWGWGMLVAQRIGHESMTTKAGAELEDNLRLLVLESPIRNLGTMAYGIAPASVFALACVVWLVLDRPRLTRGQLMVMVWVVGGWVAFSTLGKGVGRYLTPLWPGMAMLAGMWIASATTDPRRNPEERRLLVGMMAGVLLLAGVVQGWWYADGRARYFSHWSPREFVGELQSMGLDLDRLGCFRFREDAIDFYADQPVEQWGGKRGRDLSALQALVEGDEAPYYLLVWARDLDQGLVHAGDDRLGWRLEPVEMKSEYFIPQDRARVLLCEVIPAAGTDTVGGGLE